MRACVRACVCLACQRKKESERARLTRQVLARLGMDRSPYSTPPPGPPSRIFFNQPDSDPGHAGAAHPKALDH